VDPDLPIALRAYQQTAPIADAADAGLAAEPATPTPRPIGAELLLWLSLLLLDGALALLDLIGQLGQARAARAGLPARPPQAEQRSEPGPVPRSRAALAV
jgi:hypothetical protein